MKKILSIIILLLILGISINSYANFMSFSAKTMNIKILNIPNDITEIYLVSYTENGCDIRDAYKGYDMDFTDMKIMDMFPQFAYTKEEIITPFTEDSYTVNLNYNKKDYYVDADPFYTYQITDRSSFGDGSVGYYKSFKELKKDANFGDDVKPEQIICKRSISYSADKLKELKKIDLSNIDKSTLSYQMTDFSALKELDDPNSGYAFRFKNTSNEYNTIQFGNNYMFQDSYIKTTPDDSKLIKTVVIDYNTKEKVEDNSKIEYNFFESITQNNSNTNKNTIDNTKTQNITTNTNTSESDIDPSIFEGKGRESNNNSLEKIITYYIILCLIALLVTEISEIIVSFFFKIKEKLVIIITNLFTQIPLHIIVFLLSYKMLFISSGIIIIAELIVVLVEYAIYHKFLPKYTNKRLLLYSLIANLVSFSFSLLASIEPFNFYFSNFYYFLCNLII